MLYVSRWLWIGCWSFRLSVERRPRMPSRRVRFLIGKLFADMIKDEADNRNIGWWLR